MKRLLILAVLSVLAVSVGLAGSASPTAAAAPDYTAWTDLGIVYTAPGDGSAYYPSVTYDANGFGGGPVYRMWYSDGNGSVFLVTSADGVTWGAPVTATGLGGDAHHVQVVYDANCFGTVPCNPSTTKYKMWYWDIDAELYSISAIAYAESSDGIAWSNDQALTQDAAMKLVTGAGTGWNRGSYGPVYVFYQPSASNTGTDPWAYSYVMYYDGTDGSGELTGLAYSANGLHWTAYSSSPVLGGSTSAAWDCSDDVYGTVYKDAYGYHFWYSGAGADNGSGGCLDQPVHQGIGYASSPDGKAWTKDAGNPIFHINDGVDYRSGRTYTPAVINDGSGSLKMYYSAQVTSGPKKIGLATLALPPAVVGGSVDLRPAAPAASAGEPDSPGLLYAALAGAAAAALALAAGAWYARRRWFR